MKKTIAAAFAFMAVCGVAFAQAPASTLPLAEARAKIGDIIKNPASMTAVMQQLSPADQKAFVAAVNESISKMPGSAESKTATFLNVNHAAIKGAAKGNLMTIVAEVFATVPPESLTVLNERFAKDLFSRSADSTRTYSDEQFTKIAQELMAKVSERTAGGDDAGVRNTFALLMMVNASGGSPADLADTLVSGVGDESVQQMAKNEWIPAATAEGASKSYEPMLGYADAGQQPSFDLTLRIAGPQILDAMLADLDSIATGDNGVSVYEAVVPAGSDTVPAAGEDDGVDTVPRTDNPNAPWNPNTPRDENHGYKKNH